MFGDGGVALGMVYGAGFGLVVGAILFALANNKLGGQKDDV